MSDTPLRLLIVMGTRPEIIKLAPVIHAARAHKLIETIVCHSGQHTDLAEPMLDYFDVRPDVRLELMRSAGSLTSVFGNCMTSIASKFADWRPDVVVTQGDTATAAAVTLAAFYSRLPAVHVEAGLRTGDIRSPWPEEMNRRIATLSAELHCAPTAFAADKLRSEGVCEQKIVVTGNPIVDALQWTMNREGIRTDATERSASRARSVVLTAHRRENFGAPLESICSAVLDLAREFPSHRFYFITHPNPQAGPVVRKILSGHSAIEVAPPLAYPQFIQLMAESDLIISDSGGVQEEAPTLGVPLLVTRDSTERPEVLHCGAAELVGTNREAIRARAAEILKAASVSSNRKSVPNPFGDGQAGKRIINAIVARWGSGISD